MLRKTCSAVLLTMLSASAPLMAQTIRVLVLDALSGKPQSGVEVHYFCQSAMHNFLPADSDITNSEGIALVAYTCKQDHHLQMFVTALPKEECGDVPSLTFEQVSTVGVISPANGAGMDCPTKVSRKLNPVPGQVIIFIKKPSWWQAHFDG